MKVDGKHYRSLWWNSEKSVLEIIDQRWLPHDFRVDTVQTMDEFANAIVEMRVRGAPLIGATAAYAMALAMKIDPSNNHLDKAWSYFHETRPTAINLRWALNRCKEAMLPLPESERAEAALQLAHFIADEDVEINAQIGQNGLAIIREIAAKKKPGEPVNILTHCNAGWLAFVDYGSATSPIYTAFDKGIDLHVWVDETRPRNQGARLTAWELGQHGIPHTVIPDNTGGHLMQHGLVDMVIVGSDRTTANGDVANKIGTYLKALAAKDNNIPFYTALPSSTFDWELTDGVKQIPIEQRPASEVQYIQGLHDGEIKKVLLTPENSNATNFGFDVTPARLVTGLITERGVCEANKEAIAALYS